MTLNRIVRAAAAFCVLLATYGAYSFTVVPLIEPRAEAHLEQRPAEPRRVKGAQNRLKQYGRYFPPGAWELQDAKMLESDEAIIFVREYKNLKDGRVELHPFTMLLISRDKREGPAAADARAIVLEAPHGAVLQFDEGFDLKRAKLGKLVGGQLIDKIHIHNSPRVPGAADELDIRTRDVSLVGDKIVTSAVVDFRFGPNWGTGREMTILLGRKEQLAGKDDLGFSGIKTLTLFHDVQMRMNMAGKSLMPGAEKSAAKQPAGASAAADPAAAKPNSAKPTAAGQARSKPNDPPVEVKCQGQFKFDVAHNVATFVDQVDVLRPNLSGPSDTMRCELLAIYFAEKKPAPKEPAAGQQTAAPIADQEKPRDSADAEQLSKLEPRLIEARGEPVIVHSLSNGGHVRCQRLEYDLVNGIVRLEDAKEVFLTQGPNEIRCPRLDYQPPKIGRLGRLSASGPGTLQGTPEGDSAHRYQARWAKSLTMQPDGPLSLVTLLGDAQMRLTDTGALSANEIYVWLSETPDGARPAAPASPGADLGARASAAGIQIERLMAQQRVRIDSLQLTGSTNKLEVWIERPAAVPAAAPAAPASGVAAAPAAAPAPAPKPAARPNNSNQKFDVSGGALRMRVLANGATTSVAEVDVDDNARLVETKTTRIDEKPLLIRGQNLHVSEADTPNPHMIVSGKPGYIEARGMTLSGAVIQMLRGTNRLWVDGAGRMTLPTQGQLASPRSSSRAAAPRTQRSQASPVSLRANDAPSGQRPAPPPSTTPLEITWQGGMVFDGLTATFDRSVYARTEHQSLRAALLKVTLKRRVDFSNPPPTDGSSPQGGANEVDVVDCRGEVRLEARGFDEKGLESIDHMELVTLSLNQTTGAIGGQGPGWVNTVRRGGPTSGPLAQGGPAGAGPQRGAVAPGAGAASTLAAAKNPAPGGKAPAAGPAAVDEEGKQLSYLHVTFERDLRGNINRRELTFADRVRATFGPVDDWQAKIDPDDLKSVGKSGIVMNCDELTVREAPNAVRTDRGVMEMEAIGGTLVEGQTFTARAHRLTYAEAKDLLVFEGNGRSDAELYRQVVPGTPATKATARKIMYWRSTNRAEVDDARYIDLTMPGPPSNAPVFKDPLMKKK